jgi:hypothetical protein
MTETNTDIAIFIFVVALRLLVPLAIPRYPLPAIIAALIIDAVDQTIFQIFTDSPLEGYQSYDKALDIYYLTIAYLSTMRNWNNLLAFEVSRFLYYYRLVGVVLFELFQIRAILLIFPNTFEYFFIFYEAVRTRWNPLRMSKRFVIGAAAFIWIFIKLPQEYWIHVAQLDTTDLIKGDLFGVPVDTPWNEIIADNPLVFVGLAIVLVGIVLGARWIVKHKLPPPDWTFTMDADANKQEIDQAARDEQAHYLANMLFDRELVEKITLISLVSVIFARIIPNLEANDLNLAIGIAIVIVINAAVSEILARRGHDWASIIRQFLTMAAINTGIAVVFTILPFGTEAVQFGALLFFVLLLSLLITFYDRYRPVYLARFGDSRRTGAG